jgi:TolB protein
VTLRRAAVALTVAVTILSGAPAARAAFPGEPDRILFSRLTSDGWEVRSIRPNGTGGRLVIDRFAQQFAGRWSPDGSRVVFGAATAAGSQEIWTSDPDGAARRRLTRNDVFDHAPAWGPRAAHVTWSRFTGSEWRLMVARSDGRRAHAIHSTPYGILQPSWSPDGRWIAFSTYDGADHDVWLVRPDGRRLHRLTTGDGDEFSGDFSPDGERLVYTVTVGVVDSIRIARVDGSGSRAVADESEVGDGTFSTVFLPDGKRIAYASQDGHDTELFTIRPDGSGIRQVTDNEVFDWTVQLLG